MAYIKSKMNDQILHKERFLTDKLKSTLWLFLGLCAGTSLSYIVFTLQVGKVAEENDMLSKLISQQSVEISTLRAQSMAQLATASPEKDQAPSTDIRANPLIPTISTDTTTEQTKSKEESKSPKTSKSIATAKIEPRIKSILPPPSITHPAAKNKDEPSNNPSNKISTTSTAAPATPPVPTPAATPAALPPAQPAVKIVKATFSQANISGIDGNGITFKTGLVVSIGGTFPSGEKLLSVSPTDKKIVTNQRIILLKADDVSIAH